MLTAGEQALAVRTPAPDDELLADELARLGRTLDTCGCPELGARPLTCCAATGGSRDDLDILAERRRAAQRAGLAGGQPVDTAAHTPMYRTDVLRPGRRGGPAAAPPRAGCLAHFTLEGAAERGLRLVSDR